MTYENKGINKSHSSNLINKPVLKESKDSNPNLNPLNREKSSVILQQTKIKDQSSQKLKTVSNQNIYKAST